MAEARAQTSCTASALISLGDGRFLGHQLSQAGHGVKAGHPAPAGIDDHTDAINGQAALGQRCGQHQLALARGSRGHCGVLSSGIEVAIQRRELDVRGQIILQLLYQAADLGLAGQKHQHAALLLCQHLTDGGPHLIGDGAHTGLLGRRSLGVAGLYGKGTALTAEHRSPIEQSG